MGLAGRDGSHSHVVRASGALCLLLGLLAACEEAKQTPSAPVKASAAVSAASAIPAANPAPDPTTDSIDTEAPVTVAAAGVQTGGSNAPPVTGKRCPEGMVFIAGGEFWVGSAGELGASEESPRFKMQVAGFCLDVTEVTVKAYRECVEAGRCKPANDGRRFCNLRWEGRDEHPINCVDWFQARDYCAWRNARLPAEEEWEYAARGGDDYREFSWGNEKPDRQVCWMHPGGSCEVKQFEAGAFGLYDMTGNVWEWTRDSFGTYPWAPDNDLSKVYRGGSWSRRFAKWMRTRLRNRYAPKEWGSHLGMRCALTPPGVSCAYGKSADGGCNRGVEEISCSARKKWNGARCAYADQPKCPAGRAEKPGFGCVSKAAADEGSAARPRAAVDGNGAKPAPSAAKTTPISRTRSPSFDPDCQKHYPGKPHAYRYVGGTHAKRNHAKGQAGCSNRDVGVGWNSCCCP